jgi:hypothetical protein
MQFCEKRQGSTLARSSAALWLAGVQDDTTVSLALGQYWTNCRILLTLVRF